MKRRQFVALLGATAVWPSALRAQQSGRIYRVGFLWDSPTVWPHALKAFRDGLRDLGWIEGKNIVIEFRWAEGHFDQLATLTDDLVRLKVDIIVAPTSIYTAAAKRATSTIPIVFVSHADAVGSGHIKSLSRPGGNITGLTLTVSETNAKLLEICREIIPELSRIAIIFDPATPSYLPSMRALRGMALALGIEVLPVGVRSAAEFDGSFATIARSQCGAVIVLSTPLFIGAAKLLAELAMKHKLPSMFGPRENVEAGGLLSYGPDRADLYRRAATYVDQILKGANPATLPVQQATKFEFVINLKTAKLLGVTIPDALITRADAVIE